MFEDIHINDEAMLNGNKAQLLTAIERAIEPHLEAYTTAVANFIRFGWKLEKDYEPDAIPPAKSQRYAALSKKIELHGRPIGLAMNRVLSKFGYSPVASENNRQLKHDLSLGILEIVHAEAERMAESNPRRR